MLQIHALHAYEQGAGLLQKYGLGENTEHVADAP